MTQELKEAKEDKALEMASPEELRKALAYFCARHGLEAPGEAVMMPLLIEELMTGKHAGMTVAEFRLAAKYHSQSRFDQKVPAYRGINPEYVCDVLDLYREFKRKKDPDRKKLPNAEDRPPTYEEIMDARKKFTASLENQFEEQVTGNGRGVFLPTAYNHLVHVIHVMPEPSEEEKQAFIDQEIANQKTERPASAPKRNDRKVIGGAKVRAVRAWFQRIYEEGQTLSELIENQNKGQ